MLKTFKLKLLKNIFNENKSDKEIIQTNLKTTINDK